MSIIRNLYDAEPIHSNIIILSQRKFVGDKIKKPPELKGIKQSFTVDTGKKTPRCQAFVQGNDVYLKYRVMGEAWIRIENIVLDIQNGYSYLKPVKEMLRKVDALGNYTWHTVLEKTYQETANYLKLIGA